jgi:hypothetical protein
LVAGVHLDHVHGRLQTLRARTSIACLSSARRSSIRPRSCFTRAASSGCSATNRSSSSRPLVDVRGGLFVGLQVLRVVGEEEPALVVSASFRVDRTRVVEWMISRGLRDQRALWINRRTLTSDT